MLEAIIVLDLRRMQINKRFNGLTSKTFGGMAGMVIAHHHFLRNLFSYTIVLEENLIQFNTKYILTVMGLFGG